MVLVLFWILNTVFLIFVLCLWSDQSKFMVLSKVFLISGLVQVLFLSHVVNFLFFSSHFCATSLKWMCSEVHILTSYCFYGAHWLRIAQSKGSTRLGDPLLENGNRAGFPKHYTSLKKLRWCTKPQKRRLCQLKPCSLIYLHLIWWCRPWFGCTCPVKSNLLWYSLVQHFLCKFKLIYHINCSK